ncbi:unnamed protein product [Allacma fusca]|uniref:CHK kinase-like domain-containing protein n=1 Tax=Allacma fusca TaxID=39272 RepID=A0A8J2JHC2_9HEXA|nr:unnamed protein product [Allacma fusca]
MEHMGLGKEYLENALGYSVDKFELTAGSNLGDGYTCALLRVDVWKVYDEPGDPISIIVKCYPLNESRQEFLESWNIFKVELGMYERVIPALTKFLEILPESERMPLPFAPMIFGQYIKPEDRLSLGRPLKPSDNSIVMPDLRKMPKGPFILRDRFLGFDLDHCMLVIENQARLHAIAWAYKSKRGHDSLHEEFPFLDNKFGELLKAFSSYTEANIRTNEALFHDRPEILGALEHLKSIYASVEELYYECGVNHKEKGHTKDNILKVPGEIVQDEVPWRTLLHGDCWSNNMMFRYDEETGRPVQVIFIDLQISRESDPMIDISYALFTSAQLDVRRKHLKSMLHVYFDTFTEICDKFSVEPFPGWSWKEFNRRFHRAQVIGGYMALDLHIMLKCTDEMENLDDTMAKLDTKGEDETDNTQKVVNFFTQIANTKKVHPAFLPRFSAVFEELIEDGIL